MKNIIRTFGRRTDGSYQRFQVSNGISCDPTPSLSTTTNGASLFTVSFRGHNLELLGWIANDMTTKSKSFKPEMIICIPNILKWCKRHKGLTRDLFEKHNLRFISPKTGGTGLKFTFNKHYEEYMILVHEFLNECRFVDEWLDEIMDCD